MDETTTRLRQLGYHQDLDGRWLHGALGVWLVDPEQLLALPREPVEAFHDEALWPALRPAPRPLMDAGLSHAAIQAELVWDGWLGTWSSPSGLVLGQPDLARLGAEGIAALETARSAWLAEHGRRRVAGCTGMAVMIAWLGAGWMLAGSVTVWLIGMAVIAVGSWLTRPVPWPAELNPEPPDTRALFDAASDRLGEAWHAVVRLTAPILADADHLHLLGLDRSIAIDTLLARFTPDDFLRILHTLEVLDEDEPDGAAG